MFPKEPIFLFFLICALYADPIGIVGGTDNGSADAYVAHVSSAGEATELMGITSTFISRVDINNTGFSIIGSANSGYAALVSPTGEVLELSLPTATTIRTVAINEAGSAIIGGRDTNDFTYAALVSSSGTVQDLTLSMTSGGSVIQSAAINNATMGTVAIVGGIAGTGGGSRYAAIISQGGSVTEVTGDLPGQSSVTIQTVAINDSAEAIIGANRMSTAFPNPSCSTVDSSGVATAVTGTPTNSVFSSVAINNDGNAIIGGSFRDVDLVFYPYVARLSYSGGMAVEVTEGPGAPVDGGSLSAVAINSLGNGIIGGIDHGDTMPYVALVQGDMLLPITGDLPIGEGIILSVAINEEGEALIGGFDNGFTTPYVAFVSSSGVATLLTGDFPMGEGEIDSVAINSFISPPPPPTPSGISTAGLGGNSLSLANYLNTLANDPAFQSIFEDLAALSQEQLEFALASINPLRIASSKFVMLNAQFSFDQMLFSRLTQYRIVNQFPIFAETQPEFSLLTASLDLARDPEIRSEEMSAWAQGFGLFSHQDGEDTNPSFDATSGGFLIGFDSMQPKCAIYGFGLGYAHNTLTQEHHQGKSTSEMAVGTLYGGFFNGSFFLNGALWAGYNWIKSSRNVAFPEYSATAKSKFHSWQLGPHLDLGYSASFSWGGIEPFASFDCPFVFTEGFQEHGADPLNMSVDSETAILLRSEVGLNFYEWKKSEAGFFAARQTLSYVNKKPFSVGRVTAAVVGQVGSFTVETFRDVEHLFSPTFEFFFKKNWIFTSLLYHGEFGSGYIANEVIGKIGIYF